MTFAQYLRIENDAGGVGCSDRQFIEAAHGLLSPDGRKRWLRDARHAWLRDGLEMKDKSLMKLCEWD
jgi:hypothetical protein